MSLSLTLRGLLLAGVLPAAAAAQSLFLIPDFDLSDLAEDQFVVASGRQAGQAARYVPIGGIQAVPGAAGIRATSASGGLHAGWQNINGAIHAARWFVLTGWVPLPQPAGTVGDYLNPTGMSDDGTVIVGIAATATPQAQNYVAWRWTSAGGTQLLLDPASVTSEAHCVSGDGAWVGGGKRNPSKPYTRAVRWSSSGSPYVVIPETFPGVHDHSSQLRVLNHDGSLGAGYFGADAFLWEEGVGPTLLPRPADAGSANFRPSAMAEDGSLITGYAIAAGGVEYPGWYWTPTEGIRWIDDVAAQLRLDPGDSPRPFDHVADCNASGLRLAGTQPAAGGGTDSWALSLPAGGVGHFVDLGQGLVGDTAPQLQGFGSLGGGTDFTLRLSAIKLATTAYVVVGVTQLSAPFKGGVLVPDVDLLVPVSSVFSPNLELDTTWPVGLPSGASVWFQAWQAQAGGPLGWAASNGLQAITP